MTGRNQHHIPQFYQRGFGVRRSGKPKEIWEFSKDRPPERRPIKDAAAEFDFYSEPSTDGVETLDDRITTVETQLARHVAQLRALPSGATVDANVAAHIVTHLAPRTSHLRLAFAKGMAVLLRGAADVFGDVGNVRRMIGLDRQVPTELFTEHMASALQDERFQALDLPNALLQQIAFRIAREKFDTAFGDHASTLRAFVSKTFEDSDQAIRESHNKALSEMLGANVRRADLATFEWRLEPAVSPGAVLPDCIALGFREKHVPSPFMFVGRQDLSGVVMPLSAERMLVGRQPSAPWPDISNFNLDAAACSQSFFLAETPDVAFSVLAGLIGERSTGEIDEALEGALGKYRAPLADQVEILPHAATAYGPDELAETTPWRDFGYQLTFLGCADEAEARRIAEAVRPIISAISKVIPLHRLDGVTFAADYAEGLASVDRGVAGVAPPQTVDGAIGEGVAMCVAVVRDDQVRSRIVLTGGVGPALVDEDHPAAAWALHVFVHELANAAMTSWFDDAFPGVLLSRSVDTYDWGLYVHTSAAVDGYVAARFSAGFAIDEDVDVYRELVSSSLTHAQATILPARLAYRSHGDIEAFLRIAYGAAAHIVQFAAKLVGHCEGLEISPLNEGLRATLEHHALDGWLETLQEDLEQVWRRRGRWSSPEELFVINRHLERVLWQFGVFPWQPEGQGARVEIPVISDAVELLQGLASGAIAAPEGFDVEAIPIDLRRELGLI